MSIAVLSNCTFQQVRLHGPECRYQVLAVEQVSVNAKEGGNDCCIYLAVEQVYYT